MCLRLLPLLPALLLALACGGKAVQPAPSAPSARVRQSAPAAVSQTPATQPGPPRADAEDMGSGISRQRADFGELPSSLSLRAEGSRVAGSRQQQATAATRPTPHSAPGTQHSPGLEPLENRRLLSTTLPTQHPAPSTQPAQGLTAVYYDQLDFSGKSITRTDPAINFAWGSAGPDPAVGGDTFSARWTGTITPRFSEQYTFHTLTDGGVRLWINGKLVIDHWRDQAATERTGTVTLQANQPVPIRMEYYERHGAATAQLMWSSGRQARGVVPAVTLAPTTQNITAIGDPPPSVREVGALTYNVRDFGAVGDGKTDDHVAIQAAIDAAERTGGQLLFPSGVYVVSRYVKIKRATGLDIIGDNATLKAADNAPITSDLGDILRIVNSSRFTVRGLAFDGNQRVRGMYEFVHSLRMHDCSDFEVSQCTFDDAPGDHIYLAASDAADHATGTRDGKIIDCLLRNAHRNAISVIHGYRLEIRRNTIEGVAGLAPGCGIDIEANDEEYEGANHHIVIADNCIRQCAQTAIMISEARRPRAVHVTANKISECVQGVYIGGADCRVAGNEFAKMHRPKAGQGSRGSAVIWAMNIASGELEISNNRIRDVSELFAIRIHRSCSTSVVISENRISDVRAISAVIDCRVDGGIVIKNVIERSEASIGIVTTANRLNINANVLRDGSHTAIYCEGSGHIIQNNTIFNYGRVKSGECIKTYASRGGSRITGNTLSATIGQGQWVAIISHVDDQIGVNSATGLRIH